MEELKKYLAPSLSVVEFEGNVFTLRESQDPVDDDPYGESGWWNQ